MGEHGVHGTDKHRILGMSKQRVIGIDKHRVPALSRTPIASGTMVAAITSHSMYCEPPPFGIARGSCGDVISLFLTDSVRWFLMKVSASKLSCLRRRGFGNSLFASDKLANKNCYSA